MPETTLDAPAGQYGWAPASYRRRRRQSGQSLVELALTLPILIFIFLGTADLGRLFYAHVSLTGAAHKGAMYGSSSSSASTDAIGIQNAALADLTTLFDRSSGNPTITSSTTSDPYGYQMVTVRLTYTFRMLFPYPGLPGTVAVDRSVSMRVKP